MTRNIYALLIGIDQYPEGVRSLQGCVNDITAIETYLLSRINRDKYQIYIKKLLNEKAKRQAIIDEFETHLCQAGSEDIALFYYSGHGSYETAPPEFERIEPDRRLETIVCYDSRLNGGFDLADKELAYLLSKVYKNHPQIVLIADCCHSGSGFRDTISEDGVRQASSRDIPRDRKDFIFSIDEESQALTNSSNILNSSYKQNENRFPGANYIFFAGCHESEKAKEYLPKKRGAFSYFLLDTLENTTGSLTYREVFDRAKALVCARFKDQSPQLEATKSEFWDRPFLGFEGHEAIAEYKRYAILSCETPSEKEPRWVINLGAIHQIPEHPSLSVRFVLYEQGNSTDSVGEVEVVEVHPEKSIVKFIKTPEHLTTETTFKAILTSLPTPYLSVFLDGDESALQLLEQPLADSLYLKRVVTPSEAEYRLLARHNEYSITLPNDDRPLVKQISDYTEDSADEAIRQLEHIASWLRVVELKNPASSLPADAIKMQIYSQGEEIKDRQFRLEYQRQADQPEPEIRIKLTNTTKKRLYCVLLDLSELYAISSPFFDNAGVWLDGGGEVYVTYKDDYGETKLDIPFNLPRELWEQGITEYQDILKLIVSTKEFDPKPLCQKSLNAATQREVGTERKTPAKGDWLTSQVSLVIIRPQDSTSIAPDNSAQLGAGVTIQAHRGLQAQVRLTSSSQVTRDLGTRVLPGILRDYTRPFQFTSSRGVDSGLNALELSVDNLETLKSVTPKAPLTITVDQELDGSEYVLPIAYDGEFVIPLGLGKAQDKVTEIRIDRLPDPEAARSLGGAIQIMFHKVIAEKLGREFTYPHLAAVDSEQPDQIVADPTLVKQRVQQAEKIVLYIHGIIGDTRSMVSSMREAKVFIDGHKSSLSEIYDLVLSFDYESLNTPIEVIAEQLRDRLAEVGLVPGHGKVLHIVAHSMGGLVSRCFIEQKGGHKVVQHLIMLGTPNGGSPWATLQDWALASLTFVLNDLLSVALPIKLLGNLIAAIEKADVTLDQMRPDSEFLKSLNACPDPKVPYTIVAGNTSIIDITIPEAKDRVKILLEKFNRYGRRMVEFPFFEDPNDIAVAVHNMKKLPSDRIYPIQIYEVGCNHLVYFTSEVGLKALAEAVKSTGIVHDSQKDN